MKKYTILSLLAGLFAVSIASANSDVITLVNHCYHKNRYMVFNTQYIEQGKKITCTKQLSNNHKFLFTIPDDAASFQFNKVKVVFPSGVIKYNNIKRDIPVNTHMIEVTCDGSDKKIDVNFSK